MNLAFLKYFAQKALVSSKVVRTRMFIMFPVVAGQVEVLNQFFVSEIRMKMHDDGRRHLKIIGH